MKHYIKTKTFLNALHVLLLAFLLAACGTSNTAADAARRIVLDRPMPEFTVNPDSVQVLQQVNLANSAYVLISFSGTRASAPAVVEECIFSYHVEKSGMGWRAGGGGGGCGNVPPDPETQPISIGSGIMTNENTSFSEVDGLVYRDDVASVRVTWQDGATQTEEVLNNSYLVVREGKFQMQKVEALDADDEVIYTNQPSVAPGKQ